MSWARSWALPRRPAGRINAPRAAGRGRRAAAAASAHARAYVHRSHRGGAFCLCGSVRRGFRPENRGNNTAE